MAMLALAMPTAPAEAHQPAGPFAATDPPAEKPPTAAEIQAKIAEIEADPALIAELKSALLDTYRKALERIRDQEASAAKAAEYDQLKQSAPGLIEAIRAELAQPVAEPKLEGIAELSSAELDLKLSAAQAELNAAKQTATQFEADAAKLNERRAQAPKDLAAAKQRLDEASADLSLLPSSDQPPELQAADRSRLRAKQGAIQQEIRAYDQEISTLESRSQLLAARRDRAARKIVEAEKVAAAWLAARDERVRLDQQAAAEETIRKMREAAEADPAIKEIAQANVQLSEQRSDKTDGVLARIAAESERLARVRDRLDSISKTHERLRQRVRQSEEIGVSDALGLQLRQQRDGLPDIRQIRRDIDAQNLRSSDIQDKLARLDEMQRDLRDIQPQLRAIQASLGETMVEAQREAILEKGRLLLEEQRQSVGVLQNDYEKYLETLSDLHQSQLDLIKEVRSFRDFVDQRVLWIRSSPNIFLSRADLEAAREAIHWLAGPESIRRLAALLTSDFQASMPVVSLAALAWVLLLGLQPRLRRRLLAVSGVVPGSYGERFSHTLGGLILCGIIAATGPLLPLLIAWRLTMAQNSGEFDRAVAMGLTRAALLWMALEYLRQLCRRNAIGEKHFRWSSGGLRLVRRTLIWFTVVAVPCAFVLWSIEEQADESWRESLGRMAFIVGMLVLTAAAYRVFRPGGWLLGPLIARRPGGWLDRLRVLWFPALLALPLFLAALAGSGYYYTALRFEQRLQATVILILILLLISALMVRWLALARRKLAIEQYRRRQAAEQAEGKPGEPSPGGEAAAVSDQVDLWAISSQARALLRTFVVFGVIIGLWTAWADVLPALAALEDIKLWNSSEIAPTSEPLLPALPAGDAQPSPRDSPAIDKAASLRDLLLSIVILTLTILASKNLPGLLEITILQRLPITASSRYATATIARYAIAIVGIVIAFNNIGIGWSKVQWIAAAVTVGLGFGLQETIANFVSGLILLFEQPIRVGDTVTVGATTGTVTRIRIRATTIIDWDRKELVIPNKEFVTGQIINWSLSDTVMRLRVPVGIAYGSDTALARSLLLEVARANPSVLKDPEPVAVMTAFDDSALNFELRVFLPNVEYWVSTQNELLLAIDQTFRKHNVEIAFPQRDIHIRSIQGALAVASTTTPPPGTPSES